VPLGAAARGWSVPVTADVPLGVAALSYAETLAVPRLRDLRAHPGLDPGKVQHVEGGRILAALRIETCSTPSR